MFVLSEALLSGPESNCVSGALILIFKIAIPVEFISLLDNSHRAVIDNINSCNTCCSIYHINPF